MFYNRAKTLLNATVLLIFIQCCIVNSTLYSQFYFSELTTLKMNKVHEEVKIIKDLKIKTKKILTFEYKFGIPEKYGKLKNELNYDRNGNIILEINYNSGGSSLYKYQYDKNLNCIEKQIETKFDSEWEPYLTKYKYSDENLLLEEISYKKNGILMNKIIYIYGLYKNLIEKERRDIEGNITYDRIFVYNNDKRLIKEYDNLNKSNGVIYFYDENDQLLEETKTIANDISYLKYRMVYSYDLFGRIVYQIGYENSGLNESVGLECYYQYNEDGKLIKEHRPEDEEYDITYLYNSNGLLIEQTDYNSINEPEKLTKYEYTFY